MAQLRRDSYLDESGPAITDSDPRLVLDPRPHADPVAGEQHGYDIPEVPTVVGQFAQAERDGCNLASSD